MEDTGAPEHAQATISVCRKRFDPCLSHPGQLALTPSSPVPGCVVQRDPQVAVTLHPLPGAQPRGGEQGWTRYSDPATA